MPTNRCLWCPDPPLEEVAVLKWRGTPNHADASDRDRITVPLCSKHLSRLRKAGPRGRETKGWYYKEGWW